MMKKRGAIEVQFNWIFVLIAGAVILFFFIKVVNQQREFSDVKTSGTIITSLESILTGAQVSTGTVNVVEVPKVDIGFTCDKYFIGAVPRQTKGNVIFSPNLLKGKKIIMWAKDWNVPYRVTNFLYLTDPEVRYLIVYDNGKEAVANKIFDELPDEINKDQPILSSQLAANFTDKNNYKVKFIFLGNSNEDVLLKLSNVPNEDVTAIRLDIGNGNVIPNTGTIVFLQKKGTVWETQKDNGKEETYYLKEEGLFGAIFAEDFEMYNCVMKKAFKKLNFVSQIYLDRSIKLRSYYGSGNCFDAYGKAITNIRDMRDKSAEDVVKDFPIGFTLNEIGVMQDYAGNIGGTPGSANNRAALYSCVLVY